MLVAANRFYPSSTFLVKARSFASEVLNLAMHPNNRLGFNWLAVTNALAYDTFLLAVAEKSFIVQVQGPNVIKLFMAICS